MNMREIKFRFWDIDNKWIEYDPCLNKNGPVSHLFLINDMIPMQYTWLKDDNNNYIYVGDVVEVIRIDDDTGYEYEWLICEVCFWGGDYKWSFTLKNNVFHKWYALLYNPRFKINIIWNIYENSELL